MLRKGRWLSEEKEGVVVERNLLRHPLELIHGRDDVEDGESFHGPAMVERHAIGDPPASIVTNDREALEPHLRHQVDELSGHLALAVPLAQRTAGCRSALAIALQVADHNRVAFRQPRSDGVPAIVSLREAVQKQDGRAIAGDPRL